MAYQFICNIDQEVDKMNIFEYFVFKIILFAFLYSVIGGVCYFWTMYLIPDEYSFDSRVGTSLSCGLFWPIGICFLVSFILGQKMFNFILDLLHKDN